MKKIEEKVSLIISTSFCISYIVGRTDILYGVGDDKTACVTTGASQGNALDMMVLVEDYIMAMYYVHVLRRAALISN